MSGSPPLIFLAAIGFGLVVLVVSVVSLLRLFSKLARDTEQRLMATLGQPKVVLRDTAANCFGLRSRGAVQARGNGVLLLTPDVLAFQLWVRGEPIVIERATISTVSTTRGRLVVEFDGQADQITWYVRKLPPWLAALRP